MSKKQSKPAEEELRNEEVEAEEAVQAECDTPAEEPAAEEKTPTPEEALAAELAESKDRYLRLCAEYDNFRKRTQKEKEAIHGDAVAKTVEALLPVIDNLSRAVDAAGTTEDLESFKKGVEMTLRQFVELLEKMDIHEISAQGEPFDPNFHHAVMHEDNDSVDDNTVVEVFQKGYRMGDRVIRASMVKVAN